MKSFYLSLVFAIYLTLLRFMYVRHLKKESEEKRNIPNISIVKRFFANKDKFIKYLIN